MKRDRRRRSEEPTADDERRTRSATGEDRATRWFHRTVGNQAVQAALSDGRTDVSSHGGVRAGTGAAIGSEPDPRAVLPTGGRPLPEGVRKESEERFGEQFDDVRIHTGRAAGELAENIGADAFSVGRDVVFAPGGFSPGTAAGRELLAHELAHVAQQPERTGRPAMVPSGHRLEADADRATTGVEGNDELVTLRTASRPFIARQEGGNLPDPGELSDEQLQRAIVLLRRRALQGGDPELLQYQERLVAELNRRQRRRFEADVETLKEREPGVLSALLPARTKPYYKDPSDAMQTSTMRALTRGSKEQTFGGLMAGQHAAQAASIPSIIAGGVVIAIGGAPIAASAATVALEGLSQAGWYVLSVALTNPVKTQIVAEFSAGMVCEIALAGGIEGFFEQLQTIQGATGVSMEIVLNLILPLRVSGSGGGRRATVETTVESVDEGGTVTAKVRSEPEIETAGKSKKRAESATSAPEGTSRSREPPEGSGTPTRGRSESPTMGEWQASRLGYPEAPEGHHWVGSQSGRPYLRRNPSYGGERRVYDPESGEFTKASQAAKRSRPTLPRGTQADRLPDSQFRTFEERLRGDAVSAQRRILDRAQESPKAARQAGREYQELIARDLRAAEVQESFSRAGRRMDVGTHHEVTIEGRGSGGFSTTKLNQLWSDLRDNEMILLTVPRLSSRAADQLRRLGAQAQKEFGHEVLIVVRETAPDTGE